jgi:hypothetical protein
MISCRQRVLHLSDPAGWTVVSRELVYKRADGTVITEYVDEKQFRLVSEAPDKIRRTHLTRSQSTVQLIWIDAQGNERPNPPINFPQRQALQMLQRKQKGALIGKPINPENIEMILRPAKQRARRIYESNYCGRRAFVLDFGNALLQRGFPHLTREPNAGSTPSAFRRSLAEEWVSLQQSISEMVICLTTMSRLGFNLLPSIKVLCMKPFRKGTGSFGVEVKKEPTMLCCNDTPADYRHPPRKVNAHTKRTQPQKNCGASCTPHPSPTPHDAPNATPDYAHHPQTCA